MEQTPEEQLMLLLSHLPPHYGLFFRVIIIIIIFLFGCKYFLSMAYDYIAKKLAQTNGVEFYYEAAKKVYAAPDIDSLSERSAEHFASFFFCWTNSLILDHIKSKFAYPNATITCVYDKNIPHLNQTGDENRPDAQFFLKLRPEDHKLRYLYGCEFKGELSGVKHDKAAAQMINGVKLQSPTTNYLSIFATIVGTQAQLHSYSFIGHTHLTDPCDLIHLAHFKDFANELVETIINALEPEQYATPSSHPETHLVCTNSPTPATRIHVLKCIRFPSNVIEVFRLSLSRLRVSKKDFVLKVQSASFAETEKPPPSRSSQASNLGSSVSKPNTSLSNHRVASPQTNTASNTASNKARQKKFFSALFAYRPGQELDKHDCVVLSRADFNTLLQKVHDLHKAGFVHNDIRPPNIIVDHRGELHLIDFGYCLQKQQLEDHSQKIQDIATILRSLTVFTDFGTLSQMLEDLTLVTPSDVEQLWKICVISDLYQITRLWWDYNPDDPIEAQKSLIQYYDSLLQFYKSTNFDSVHSFKLD